MSRKLLSASGAWPGTPGGRASEVARSAACWGCCRPGAERKVVPTAQLPSARGWRWGGFSRGAPGPARAPRLAPGRSRRSCPWWVQTLVPRQLRPGCSWEQRPFCARFRMNSGNVGTLMLPSGESSGERLLCPAHSLRIAIGRDLADGSLELSVTWFRSL